jgi:ketosteroid isomerase-like protein
MLSSSLRTVALVTSLITLTPQAAATEPAAQGPSGDAVAASGRRAAEVVQSFHAALRRGDTRSAAALLADDALIFESGGVERSKAEYASHHLPADAAFAKAVPSARTRRTGYAIGDLAWIATEGRTTGTYNDKPVDRVTTETMLLRRMGKSWKIVHIHWSSGAPKN